MEFGYVLVAFDPVNLYEMPDWPDQIGECVNEIGVVGISADVHGTAGQQTFSGLDKT